MELRTTAPKFLFTPIETKKLKNKTCENQLNQQKKKYPLFVNKGVGGGPKRWISNKGANKFDKFFFVVKMIAYFDAFRHF